MPEQKLPMEVHDHFRKANVLHGYVAKSLGEAKEHALETGEYLLAAKLATPPGRWEKECNRLFDGSLRTAQFYMQFAKHMSALPKAQASALLMLEGTLDGAAKAAKKAATPTPPKPASQSDPAEPPDAESEEGDIPEAEEVEEEAPPPDYGKCPVCAGTKWKETDSGIVCAKCQHPHGEPAGDPDEERIKTQRAKTVKTVEATMRAFDDLQAMKASHAHGMAIGKCKELLNIAKGWK